MYYPEKKKELTAQLKYSISHIVTVSQTKYLRIAVLKSVGVATQKRLSRRCSLAMSRLAVSSEG